MNNKDVFLKFVTSCTKDEAVARMLGWMQEPIYDVEPELTDDNNVPLEYLPYLSSMPNSIEEQLTYLVGEAQAALDDAKASIAEPEVIKQKEADLSNTLEWIDKSAIYLVNIVDELAKGEKSALRIDQEATEKSGTIHITIKSLDEWASDFYSLPTPVSLRSAPAAVKQLADSQKNKGGSTTKLDNLCLSFAFLIDAFAKEKPKYWNADKVNITQLANYLSDLATKDGERMQGQSVEAIKTRIEESIRKKEQLF